MTKRTNTVIYIHGQINKSINNNTKLINNKIFTEITEIQNCKYSKNIW